MTPAAIAILAAIRRAATAGQRCPDNDQLADAVYAAGGRRWRQGLDELTKTGVIKIEVAGKNWRVVTILADGLRTAPEPAGRRAWLVVDTGGSRRAIPA